MFTLLRSGNPFQSHILTCLPSEVTTCEASAHIDINTNSRHVLISDWYD